MFLCTHMHTHMEGGGINVNYVGMPLVSPGEFGINYTLTLVRNPE
jgi:hypothetical protein